MIEHAAPTPCNPTNIPSKRASSGAPGRQRFNQPKRRSPTQHWDIKPSRSLPLSTCCLNARTHGPTPNHGAHHLSNGVQVPDGLCCLCGIDTGGPPSRSMAGRARLSPSHWLASHSWCHTERESLPLVAKQRVRILQRVCRYTAYQRITATVLQHLPACPACGASSVSRRDVGGLNGICVTAAATNAQCSLDDRTRQEHEAATRLEQS